MTDDLFTRPELGDLATALSEFQAEMPTVAKAHTATVKSDKGQYSYTYAGLADVTEAAMPLLSKHGLSFVTLPGQGVLTGMLLHKSGQSITGSLPISGSTPQQVGSSLTYMRRYLLGCMTGLVTDDDDDGQLAETAPKARRAAKKAETEPAATTRMSRGQDKPMSPAQSAHMFALFGEKGITDRDVRLAGISRVIGRPVESSKELSASEASQVINSLNPPVPEEHP